MGIERALEESDQIAEELLAIVDLPLCNDSARTEVAAVACSLSLEHWHATRILIHAGALSSALVVHRSQFEAVLRSVWLTYAASEADVAKLTDKLTTGTEQAAKNVAQTQLMLEALAKSGPQQAYDALARFKDNSWKALNSYAHAGIHPLVRHAEGYPEPLALGVLRNSNGLGLCVFRPKLDTDSGANWTPIPRKTGQRFRRKLDTDSGVKPDSFRGPTGIA